MQHICMGRPGVRAALSFTNKGPRKLDTMGLDQPAVERDNTKELGGIMMVEQRLGDLVINRLDRDHD